MNIENLTQLCNAINNFDNNDITLHESVSHNIIEAWDKLDATNKIYKVKKSSALYELVPSHMKMRSMNESIITGKSIINESTSSIAETKIGDIIFAPCPTTILNYQSKALGGAIFTTNKPLSILTIDNIFESYDSDLNMYKNDNIMSKSRIRYAFEVYKNYCNLMNGFDVNFNILYEWYDNVRWEYREYLKYRKSFNKQNLFDLLWDYRLDPFSDKILSLNKQIMIEQSKNMTINESISNEYIKCTQCGTIKEKTEDCPLCGWEG